MTPYTVTLILFNRHGHELVRETRPGLKLGQRISVWAAANQRALARLAQQVDSPYTADAKAVRAIIRDNRDQSETRFTFQNGRALYEEG